MRITNEADYALRIMAALASGEKSLDAKSISEQSNIPYRFTLKILRKIVSAGYLRSRRGVNGGYELAVPASEITLKDIIEVIDGDIAINRCLGSDRCPNSPECKVREHMANISEMIAEELSKVTFADLV